SPHNAADHRFRVGFRRSPAPSRLFGTLSNMEHVATRGLDEQRFLGAEVVGDLARKGIGCAGNRCDGSAIETVRLEKCACRIEKPGPHLLAGGAGCTHAVTGGAGHAAQTLLGAYAADVISVIFDLSHRRLLGLSCLYIIQTR